MKQNKFPEENISRTAPMKNYWKSIEDDRGPEAEHDPGEENAAGLDRRSFLTLMGASAAMAGLAGCRRPEEKIVPYVSKPEDLTLGIPQRYATSMPLGSDCYRLLVTAHEGRPTHIEGNRLDKSAQGSTNVWASASLLGLYDPDRSQSARNNGVETTMEAFAAFMEQARKGFQESQGEGLAVLTESFASPTMHGLAAEFRTTFPKAVWATYDPVSDENILKGNEIAFGKRLHTVHDLSKADIIVSLDSDFLGSESRMLVNARAFTKRRNVLSVNDDMNRLYLVESGLSQTAAMADHRICVRNGLIGAFGSALARELGNAGILAFLPDFPAHDFPEAAGVIRAMAADLAGHRGRSLVLAGRRQGPEVHALAAVMNFALGNAGATVSYAELPYSQDSDTGSLSRLAEAMAAGKVKFLAILGGNPAYNAPADVKFADAVSRVSTVLHLSSHVDETSVSAQWHIPMRHYLESWGDAASIDGSIGVIQPLIEPLYDGMSCIELLAFLTRGAVAKGYDLVREAWRRVLAAGDSDAAFQRVLHDGIFAGADPRVALAPDGGAVARSLKTAAPPAKDPPGAGDLELVFNVSPAVHDGRYANVGWLQEFPDPVTKVTWDNVAAMNRRTAEALGLKNKELVRLTNANGECSLPVWIMPGQADFSVSVALGYGRIAAGRIGNDVGGDAYRLRGSDTPWSARGLRIVPVRGSHAVACVQDHHGLDEEKVARSGIQDRLPVIVREATLEEYKARPNFAREKVEIPHQRSMWTDHEYSEGRQWAMSIDLNACTGCGACTIACQSENNIPIVGKREVLNGRELHWIRVDRYYAGSEENPEVLAQPVACVHCEMAPCEQVCPVAATSHDEEGLNVMTYNRCVGTRYCSNNCPYKVRRFNFYNYTKDLPDQMRMAQNPDVTVRFRGVMEKCTFCTQRIEVSRIAAKRDGRDLADGDVTPACESACPTQAIVFGDLLDPESRISRMKKSDRDYALLGELNLRPRTTYLAKLRNPNPRIKE